MDDRTASVGLMPTGVTHTYRYIQWKALVWGSLALVCSIVLAWGAVDAPVPAAAQEDRNIVELILHAPAWVRVPLMLPAAGAFLTTGVWMFFALLTNAPVVRITQEWIEARTIFAGRRRIAWTEIVDARSFKDQILLSSTEIKPSAWYFVKAFGTEAWKSTAVIVDMNMIDAPRNQVELLIARCKPGLVVRPLAPA